VVGCQLDCGPYRDKTIVTPLNYDMPELTNNVYAPIPNDYAYVSLDAYQMWTLPLELK